MARRQGLTMVELLVVLGIIGVLFGLLLSAIIQIREVALRTQSANNMRQIVLATEHYASSHDSALPTIGERINETTSGPSLYYSIMPYTEMSAVLNQWSQSGEITPIKLFLSPADPTVSDATIPSICSYAVNAQVFKGNPRLPATFVDGTSTTIAFAEHYAANCDGTSFDFTMSSPEIIAHRASFADAANGDVFPVTTGNPPVSLPSIPGSTFQVAPIPPHSECRPAVAQTPHRAGMLVAMADGSVRTLNPNIASVIYWGAVTPDGGEMLPGDW